MSNSTPMSKRLPELLRQRTILQEHLAWLDREIAAEQGIPPATAPAEVKTPPALPAGRPAVPNPPASTEIATADIDHIVASYRQDPLALQQDTRRDILKLFWLLLGGFFLLAGIAYALYARHIGRWW